MEYYLSLENSFTQVNSFLPNLPEFGGCREIGNGDTKFNYIYLYF